MSASRIAVVGSGMFGSAAANLLCARGHEVTVFEKGPDYPYPHEQQFLDAIHYEYHDPAYEAAADLRHMTMSGDYKRDLGRENVFVVGGSGTMWSALTPRMVPSDFETRRRFGYGRDWPLGYDDLEPWLCRAEAWFGVAGTDDDNPFAAPRSRPYPLPAFELTEDDRLIAGRLETAGIHVHTTPQARTSAAYDGRPGCVNYGECRVCPIGARYSPNHHLQIAVQTGRCRVLSNTSVRRILTDAAGRARGVLYRPNSEAADVEFAADRVIVAAAAFESARLLLLSRDPKHPDGVGNSGGQVGRNFVLHHVWVGDMIYREKLFAGRAGYWTAQSQQFCDPVTRGRHGGIKLELSSRPSNAPRERARGARSLEEALELFEPTRRSRVVSVTAESRPTPGKFITLSKEKDRFGDPVAELHYDLDDFDRKTYDYGRGLFERVARATAATEWSYPGIEAFDTFAHYMGGTSMSERPADGVTDLFGRVHDTPGLYALGLGGFPASSGASNSTLTGMALVLRALDAMAEELA